MNRLFYGDNLDVLRERIPSASVDLIYLDPPFNSNRSYNVLFRQRSGEEAQAQLEAFDDTWTWSQQSEETYRELVHGGAPLKVVDALEAMRRLLGENDVLAYLVMMTARLIELHRVLKPTGSLYLHCDPTSSHYLKVMLDAIFSVQNFRNEITWQRTGTHSDAKRWAPVSDTILYYGKTNTSRYDLTYDHPINEDLEPSTPVVGIRVACTLDGLTFSGKTAFADGESVKATCVGKIVRWDDAMWQLVINPIAIY